MKRPREDAAQLKRCESSENGRTPNQALKYLKEVKDQFNNAEKYDQFLAVMRDFKAQRIDTEQVIQRVKEMFRGYNDLIMGFNVFLPQGYAIPIEEKKPVEFNEAIHFVNRIKNRFQENPHVYKSFLDILNHYRSGAKLIPDVYSEVSALFHEHKDLLEDFKRFLPGNTSPPSDATPNTSNRKDEKPSVRSLQTSKKERGPVEKDRKKDRDRKDDHEREDYDREAEDGARLPHKRKSARRADELIRKQSQNGEAGTHAFFNQIKARLRNRESYQDLLRVLNLYTEQVITRADLQSLVSDVLGKYPDLMDGFNDLFVRSENGDVEPEGGPSKIIKVEREQDKGTREKDRDKEKDRSKDKTTLPSKEKYLNKAISELDLSNCERCTPSYRRLPKNYPRPKSSHRNDLANEVLNDDWVSVTSGSEDYSFKNMRKNQYEESLFRCEDDRFELDLLLESTNVTAKVLGEMKDEMQESGALQIRVDERLSAINWRCIERVYSDLDFLDSLKGQPLTAIPTMHARLKIKVDEWCKQRSELNKVWAEVYAKNYHKSLDHRSFYFKQQDKKYLSTKALLNEIKEIHEKRRKEDDYLLSSVMGNKRVLTPDLKFNYSDQSVHEDLFRIMKYSADEICNTTEQSDKLMRVWTLVESMFNVPSRHRGPEDAEEAAKVPKERDATSGESTASGATANCQLKDDCASKTDVSQRYKMEEVATSGSLQGSQNAENSQVHEIEGEARFRDNVSRPENAVDLPTQAPVKTEREEGELSPSPDIDEAQNGEQPFTNKVRSRKHAAARKEDHDEADREPDPDAEHEDDEGEESAQKYSEDSENASEPGDEGSGSESQDDGSRDHEEEEDGDEGREEKAESEGDAEGMADAEDGETSDRSSMLCKPLGTHLSSENYRLENSTVFYGNDKFYIFFRLHQTLYERIYSAKTNAAAAEQKWRATKDTPPPNLYQKFLRVLHDLLDGSADNNMFEDECRSYIGTQSYVLFTLDKLIYKLVKQLETIAKDETANKILLLHAYERSRAPNGFDDLFYHANACLLLPDDNIYRFEHKLESRESSIQIMDVNPEKLDSAMETRFSSYLSDFLITITGPNETKVDITRENVYLNRNKPKFDEFDALMKNVQVMNGLEHKVACRNSKVSYVLDTEDLFHRRKQQRATTDADSLAVITAERRKRKFQDWIGHRLQSSF